MKNANTMHNSKQCHRKQCKYIPKTDLNCSFNFNVLRQGRFVAVEKVCLFELNIGILNALVHIKKTERKIYQMKYKSESANNTQVDSNQIIANNMQ